MTIDYENVAVCILMNLDRCEHGRHQGDNCFGCGGPSEGNPHIRPGDVIGYGIDGTCIVMPDRDDKHDLDRWYVPRTEAV